MSTEFGYEAGSKCNRDNCNGIIQEHESDVGCSCHDNPPCSYCETSREYCPVCGWDGGEEQREANLADAKYWQEYHSRPDVIEKREKAEQRERDFWALFHSSNEVIEFDRRHQSHTHFTQIWIGVYPESMTREQVYEIVKGSFGGRFERFNNGRFKFIAYTD